MGRRRRVLLAALVAAACTTATPGPAGAAVGGACTDPEGITVVVDLTHFDGGIQVRCAPAPVTSGFDALRRAGFEVTGTQRFPGLLCRIDGEPGNDPCVNAPPSGAYWAYWHAPRGGDWTYSTSGATRRPPAGSVEGWAFGAKAEPGIAPPAAVPPSTTTTRPHPPGPSTSVPPVTSGGPLAGGAGSERGPSTTTAGSAGPSTTTTTTERPAANGPSAGDPGDGGGDDPGGGALGTPAVGASPRSDGGGAGSPLAAIVTVGLLVAVIAGVRLWRRSARPRGGIGEPG